MNLSEITVFWQFLTSSRRLCMLSVFNKSHGVCYNVNTLYQMMAETLDDWTEEQQQQAAGKFRYNGVEC